jgi:hypothetical protein
MTTHSFSLPAADAKPEAERAPKEKADTPFEFRA